MCSNSPAKPTYGVYVSQLVRMSRICDTFSTFVSRHSLLTDRLIKQGFWYSKLCTYFKKFARGYAVLFKMYGVVKFSRVFVNHWMLQMTLLEMLLLEFVVCVHEHVPCSVGKTHAAVFPIPLI